MAVISAESLKHKASKSEDAILKKLINLHKQVRIYLKMGIKVEGYIKAVDHYTIFLQPPLASEPIQMIYKHAVSTITFIPFDFSKDESLITLLKTPRHKKSNEN